MSDRPTAAQRGALDSAIADGGVAASILIVDDEARNRRLLATMLQAEGYETREAASGQEALDSLMVHLPDLVLLDVMMPGMDGYSVVAAMKAAGATRAIPVVLVTALTDREARLRGLDAGAEDFLSKPVDRVEMVVRVRNLLRLKRISDQLGNQNTILEERVRARTAELRASTIETIVTLSRAAEYKDPETGAHLMRMSHYNKELALHLGEGAEFAEAMFHASPMHDIGKIGIPDRVLLKPAELTVPEWNVMRSHSMIGWEILRSGTTRYTQLGAEIALSHHERWDGTGYPNRWAGEQIPFSGRLLNICDQYDALRSRRPYKEAAGHAVVVEIITKGDARTSPTHFDPRVLAGFASMASRFEEIFSSFSD